MERRRKVELFEQIRREYEFGCGTIIGTAQKFSVHRRMVRQAIESAVPPERKRPVRSRPKLERAREFIDRVLVEDQRAPRKQRHTAHRIYERLRAELPEVAVAERTVRQYVQERREHLALTAREVFVPQAYAPGVEAQVDWYEATVEVAGERRVVQVFCMRAMASGAAYHRAYPRATQQAFLDAHGHAFSYFGGVFHRLRYDNLTSAVKKILRGSRREETTRFILFRSHYRYEASFCTPARGNEKGGVESEVGRFRRNHLVPVPRCASFDDLNARLDQACRRDEARRVAERDVTVGAALAVERTALLSLPEEHFQVAEDSFAVVDAKGCIAARTNLYSTPLPPATRCQVRVLPLAVEVRHGGACVARHERCYGRRQQVYDLEHYLDVLGRKPGAFAGSKPLAQWRAEGRWTPAYDELWQSLQQRHGAATGTRLMIELLQAGKRTGYERLTAAITRSLNLGAREASAVRYLLDAPAASDNAPAPLAEVTRPALAAHFCRPLPSITAYDLLLGTRGTTTTEAAR